MVGTPEPPLRAGLPRWLEALLAAGCLLVGLPLLLVLAGLIRISSRGPALFRQQRVGRFGQPFALLKLRTMHQDMRQGMRQTVRRSAGSESRPSATRITASGDPRVTRIGRMLRRTKLDELPGLLNVVRGEMSWVGPRPEVAEYVDLSAPLWQQVLQARPGMTDPTTLALRSEEQLLASFESAQQREAFYRQRLLPYKLKTSLDYLQRRTAASDVAVLLRTLWTILRPGPEEPEAMCELLSAEGAPAGESSSSE